MSYAIRLSKENRFLRNNVQRSQEEPHFFNNIPWTDKSRFEQTSIFNIHNYHCWTIKNPHSIRHSNFLHRFSINLWPGVLIGELIGPLELPSRLTGEIYLHFLENNLDDLLEDVKLETLRNIFLQNDGAVKQHLNCNYPGR